MTSANKDNLAQVIAKEKAQDEPAQDGWGSEAAVEETVETPETDGVTNGHEHNESSDVEAPIQNSQAPPSAPVANPWAPLTPSPSVPVVNPWAPWTPSLLPQYLAKCCIKEEI
jgi:hypothetical protein